MPVNPDVRWQQRLASLRKALTRLQSAVALAGQRDLSELERQGLIKSFEFTHELAWNVLKDFLESRGATGIYGSRDATREAFKRGLIHDGEIWMEMIAARNASSHRYDEGAVRAIEQDITRKFAGQFRSLVETMDRLAADTT